MPKNYEEGYFFHKDKVTKSFAELKEQFEKLETIVFHGYASYSQETILRRLQEYEAASRRFLSNAHKYDYFIIDQSFEDKETEDEDED